MGRMNRRMLAARHRTIPMMNPRVTPQTPQQLQLVPSAVSQSTGWTGTPMAWEQFFVKYKERSDALNSSRPLPTWNYAKLIREFLGPFYNAGIGSQRGRRLTREQAMYWGSRGIIDGLMTMPDKSVISRSVGYFAIQGTPPTDKIAIADAITNFVWLMVPFYLANDVNIVRELRERGMEPFRLPSPDPAWPPEAPHLGSYESYLIEKINKPMFSGMWTSAIDPYIKQKLGMSGPQLSL